MKPSMIFLNRCAFFFSRFSDVVSFNRQWVACECTVPHAGSVEHEHGFDYLSAASVRGVDATFVVLCGCESFTPSHTVRSYYWTFGVPRRPSKTQQLGEDVGSGYEEKYARWSYRHAQILFVRTKRDRFSTVLTTTVIITCKDVVVRRSSSLPPPTSHLNISD